MLEKMPNKVLHLTAARDDPRFHDLLLRMNLQP